MNDKATALMFLAIALAVTWILMNSIQLLPIQAVGGASNSLGSNSLGSGNSINNGAGGGGLGGVNQGIGLGRLPGIAINLSYNWPSINGSIPFIETPIIAPMITLNKGFIGDWSKGIGLLFITTPLNTLRVPLPFTTGITGGGEAGGSITGGGGGGAGLSGSSSKGNQGLREAVTPIIIEKAIPWLIYLLIILVIVILAFSLLSSRRGGRGTKNLENNMKRRIQEEKRGREAIPKTHSQRLVSNELSLSGMPVQLRGWGGGELIKLGIDKDLPLSWRINDPLNYSMVPGASLSILPEGEVVGDSIVFRASGCHEVRARMGSEEEVHRVWVVNDYSSDVIDSFRANMMARGAAAEETPREACRRFGVECLGWSGLRVFEEVRYGGYPIDRGRYEYFLRELARLRDALIMGCE